MSAGAARNAGLRRLTRQLTVGSVIAARKQLIALVDVRAVIIIVLQQRLGVPRVRVRQRAGAQLPRRRRRLGIGPLPLLPLLGGGDPVVCGMMSNIKLHTYVCTSARVLLPVVNVNTAASVAANCFALSIDSSMERSGSANSGSAVDIDACAAGARTLWRKRLGDSTSYDGVAWHFVNATQAR